MPLSVTCHAHAQASSITNLVHTHEELKWDMEQSLLESRSEWAEYTMAVLPLPLPLPLLLLLLVLLLLVFLCPALIWQGLLALCLWRGKGWAASGG